MASTYTANGIEKITTGEQSGTWGSTTNTGFEMFEEMITGVSDYAVTDASTKTETLTDGASADFRHKIIRATGTLSQDQTITIAATDAQKEMWLFNNTTGTAELIVAQDAASTTVSIKQGTWGHLFVDGSSDATVLQNQNIPDDFKIYYGTDHDVSIEYDEATNNAFNMTAEVEGAALAITWVADQGDDAGDKWKWNVADGGVMTLGSDIASQNTFVTMVTFTPNSTVASSTVAFAGGVSIAGSFSPTSLSLPDDGNLTFGTSSDYTIDYDTTLAALTLASAVEGVAFNMVWQADQGDDAKDQWKWVVADGGTMTLANDASVADTFVTHVTFTPNATASSSTVAFAGIVTASKLTVDNLSVDGNTITADSGALNLTPASGSAIVLDGTINVDAGVVTGATSITSTAFVGTLSTAAQGNITSLGTLTALTVDNVVINGNDISSSSGNLTITPVGGSAIVLDGTINVDAGVVTGATSITSTAFVGDITGDVTGNASGTAATVTGAAQAAITSLGTLTTLTVDNITVNGNTITADTGALNLTPASGSAIVLDGTINVDAGVVTGATSITSSNFVGALDGALGGVTPAAGSVTTLTISGAMSGTSVQDDDSMASASSTTVATSESIKAYVDSVGAASTVYRKNFVINGGADVQQRGDYTLVKDAYDFGPDRLEGMATGTAVSAGILTGGDGTIGTTNDRHFLFSNVTLTGTGIMYLRTRIEGSDAAYLINKAAVFSCLVYHDVGSAKTITLTVRKADSLNDFSSTTDIGNDGGTSVNSATDTRLAYAVADMGDCVNGIELEIKFECGAITTKDLRVGEVQLEAGTARTDFEALPYAATLPLCERYYERKSLDTQAFEHWIYGMCNSTSTLHVCWTYQTGKRATPTITLTAAATWLVQNAVGSTNCNSASGSETTTKNTRLVFGLGSTPLTAGDAARVLRDDSDTAYAEADAEL